jgi:ubiquinone/menaquinone biosynthesis C-methylase UbiE
MSETVHKGYKGLPMEGTMARRYDKLRRSESQLEQWRQDAERLTKDLPAGAGVLEVAPGPGYFAIAVARLGRFQVTGLDISRTFVEIAGENARQAGVAVDFKLGDAAHMPFADDSFDLVVCQAAFKNFSQPALAIEEMYRVLRAGGTAVIHDMRKDASGDAIGKEVDGMQVGWLSSLTTAFILSQLRRRAYTSSQFEAFANFSSFGGAEIETKGISVEVRLTKTPRQ